MEVKRSYVRGDVTGEGLIYHEGATYPFSIVNISASGALIHTNYILKPGKKYQFIFNFTGKLNDFSFKTQAVVVREDKERGDYHYGIRFVHLDNKTRVELDEIIKHKSTYESDFII